MNDIVVVKVVHSLEDLANSLRGIFLRKPSLFANSIKQLSTNSQLCNYIVFVLRRISRFPLANTGWSLAYSRFEPIHKLDDMLMLHSLQHLKFVIDHLFISLDIFLEDNLHRDLSCRAICLSDDSIGTSTERSTELIFGSAISLASILSQCHKLINSLLIITFWLTMQLIEHTRDWRLRTKMVSARHFNNLIIG